MKRPIQLISPLTATSSLFDHPSSPPSTMILTHEKILERPPQAPKKKRLSGQFDYLSPVSLSEPLLIPEETDSPAARHPLHFGHAIDSDSETYDNDEDDGDDQESQLRLRPRRRLFQHYQTNYLHEDELTDSVRRQPLFRSGRLSPPSPLQQLIMPNLGQVNQEQVVYDDEEEDMFLLENDENFQSLDFQR
mmetsp:Transcript_4260/g.5613  ORF Transcript_4260/g.5613 Transcript_4260/m.5613 type:complete len:191 (+) Transcript_4260:276-848(+)|eukprot:CAMPEP_0198147556 /NCGR_PEP_ID=MMETSP1443-20131203/36583_1 /TAXON_ID=186043 /ORGANISM="Entomoneis sp., Strain CCMP2396" /LENGTH=190 /DNA_ID=CAMNT_0043811953 /DNA_START=123 /DNA_END=695 /DNA_ORIENTATION=+